MRLLEGPDLQTVDVEVLLGGQRLVVEGCAFGGGASVQLGVQPQTQLTTAEERGGGRGTKQMYVILICSPKVWIAGHNYLPSASHLQRISIALHKV